MPCAPLLRLLACAVVLAAPLSAQFSANQDQRLYQVAGAVQRALTTDAIPFVEFLGTPRQFAPGRWFALAARSRLESGAPVTVHGCAVDSAATYTAQCAVVPTPRLGPSLFSSDTATDRSEADLDGDSVPEIRFTLTYSSRSEPAVGPDLLVRHYVYRAAPAPRLVVEIWVSHDPGASAIPHRSGELSAEDANGDGRTDFVLRGMQCPEEPDEEETGCRPYTWTWLWRPATRTWTRAAQPVRTRTAPSS